MSQTIGSNYLYCTCDWHDGCHEVSEKFHYITTSIDAVEKIRKTGWYVSFVDDKSYCPEHSPYNNNNS